MIFYQDVKERLVHWWLFLIFGVSGIVSNYLSSSGDFIINISGSIVVVTLLLFMLGIYLRIVKNVSLKELESQIGLGDILFIIAWALSYNPFVFIYLYIAGLIFSMIIHKFIVSRFQPKSHVPLAGLSALFLIMIEFLKITDYFDFNNILTVL